MFRAESCSGWAEIFYRNQIYDKYQYILLKNKTDSKVQTSGDRNYLCVLIKNKNLFLKIVQNAAFIKNFLLK